MKKGFILGLILLAGCETTPVPEPTDTPLPVTPTKDEELTQPDLEYPLLNILDAAKDYLKHGIDYKAVGESSGYWDITIIHDKVPPCSISNADYSIGNHSLIEPDIRPECLEKDAYSKKYTDRSKTDDCVLYRRHSNPHPSKVCYFNYKKYLPENSSIKTDDDFLELMKLYLNTARNEGMPVGDKNIFEEIYAECEDRISCEELTNNECNTSIQECNDNLALKLENTLHQYINGGKEIEASKRQKEQADCKQAHQKSENRKKEIAKKLGVNEEGLIYSIQGKVKDFAHNGIFVSNDCSSPDLFPLFFIPGGAQLLQNCHENDWAFIYTKNTNYATGDSFSSKGFIYRYRGNYKYTTVKGSTNSIPAYEATSYKVDELDYRNYLKDKSLKCE